jgi:hypothetical protein
MKDEIVNKNLFSNHFLEEILPRRVEEWDDENIDEIFDKIKKIYFEEKDFLESYNESQLEDHFVKPILKSLGHHFEIQETTSRGRQPDYAFFPNDEIRKNALLRKGEKDFYKNAIAVGDAKAWKKSLDKKLGKSAAFEDQNPSFQIDTYLRETTPRWAILTNGRCWRIYYQETSYKLNSFYEVDLVSIIEKDDLDSFKYFYFFFRLEAFLEDARDKNFLDKVYGGSIDYAEELGEGLQENIYKALKKLAEGFLSWNKLDRDEDTIKIIHDNSLVLLYRLIFILYAESRGLLDVKNEIYNRNYSLNSLKKEIGEKYDKGGKFLTWEDGYCRKLNKLFKLINEGSKAQIPPIPENMLFIPPYNGGLFDPKRNEFLKDYSIGDFHLAKVIDLLSRSNGAFVDYSTLEIRHLGSIYEGLLEYKLNIAKEDLVSIKTKGKEIWIPKNEGNGKKIYDEISKGELYLTTDKGERKATGSYYTPEYIVKYIVENTLEPAIKEKLKEARKNGTKENDAILSIKVLDPAMGSGHFLVEAVDFLTKPLLDAVNNDIKNGLLPEREYSTDWAKREIVSHCIYGVDFNPLAVELAKLSLWLKTLSKNKPLSFLDHRLKCGNSLIGEKLENLPIFPGKERKKEGKIYKPFIDKLIEQTKKIEEISDNTLEEIKKKEEIFQQLKNSDAYKRIKILADARTATYFGIKIDDDPNKTYMNLVTEAYYGSPSKWKERSSKGWVKEGLKKAEEKHFFHWELEFPEIFYEAGKEKENPGFDVVIGNPPWITLRGKQRMGVSDEEVNYYLDEFKDSAEYKVNSFALFVDKSIELMKNKAEFSFIIPSNILTNEYLSKIRKKVLSKTQLKKVLDLGNRVFGEGVADSIIILFEKQAAISLEQEVEIYTQIKDLENNIYEVKNIAQKEYLESDGFVVNVNIGKKEISLFKKVESSSVKMKKIIKNYVGIVTGDNKKFISGKKLDLRYKEILIGKDLGRYNYNFNSRYVLFDKEQLWSNTDESIFQLPEKILLRKTGNILIACIDENQFYTEQTIYNLFPRTKTDISLRFILTLINSKLMQYYFYNKLITNPKAYPYIKGIHIDLLPIRSIFFTTPKNERKSLVEDLQTSYQNNKFVELLPIVDEHLPKDRKGNFITEKEKSDVVHDFLAFLAEQMIEMNKEKHGEIEGFLEWLEREIGAKIENLSLKTKIREYYNYGFDEFLEFVKRNKKKLAIDPSRRDFQEKLKKEFDVTMAKLKPLEEKIQKTDWSIDQIVYKLYGLTDEEIKIVKESTRK